MRTSIKRGLVAAVITASALGTGAGLAATASTASAATATAAAVTYQAPVLGYWHQMSLTANGTTYPGYWVLLQPHRGGLLTGWLWDPNLPAYSRYLPVKGDVTSGAVQFQVTYPATAGSQGSRGFIGNTGSSGLTGVFDETGAEGLAGTFTFTS